MLITHDDHLKENLLDEMRTILGGDRGGFHVSDLVGCIHEAFFKKTQPRELDEEKILLFTLGRAGQDILDAASKSLGIEPNPEQVVLMDVTGSLDGFKEGNGTPEADNYPKLPSGFVSEIKTTRSSSNKELSERYVDQVMAYCKMKNVRTAKIIVVHIVGGWKATNFMPRMKVWDITFTQDELDRHWSTMMARKGVLEFELEQGKVVEDYPPPYTWNCSYCQYTDQCPNSLK